MPAETHVEQGPLDRQEIFEIVRDRLADILEIDPSARSARASRFVDDLDADSLALIELVEALEEELSERSVGFRIEDEDLEDLKTVRDAVDYVFETGEASPDTTGLPSRPSRGALGTSSPTPRCSRQALAHRSWCAEIRQPALERAPRVPRRRRARLGRGRPRLPRSPRPARGQAHRRAQGRGERHRAGRGGPRPRGGAGAPARQGRGRCRRAHEAVDPLRRHRGDPRRGVPRRRARGRPRPRAPACSADRVARRRRPTSTTLDNKTALQELAARLFESSPAYVLDEEGPDHVKRFTAPGDRGRTGRGAWARAARRSRPSRLAAGEAVVARRAAHD